MHTLNASACSGRGSLVDTHESSTIVDCCVDYFVCFQCSCYECKYQSRSMAVVLMNSKSYRVGSPRCNVELLGTEDQENGGSADPGTEAEELGPLTAKAERRPKPVRYEVTLVS